MAERPLEYELMMTTYTQIGQELSDQVDHLDVFVPSGVEESALGFDMRIQDLKGIAMQFKRPENSTPRKFRVRYSNQDPPRQLDRMRNWELKFGPNAAFYALPLVVDHDDIAETLDRTAFIPASSIDELSSIVRVPDSYIEDGEQVGGESVTTYCSHPNDFSNNYTTTIPSSDILGWEGLKAEIGKCNAGFKIRWNGRSCSNQYHDDHIWHPKQREGEGTIHDKMQWSPADRFIGSRSPMLTRLGAAGSFGW